MRTSMLLLTSFCFLSVVSALAMDEGDAITDRKKVDKDFTFQGEYEAKVERDGQEARMGVQVIVLGDGKFRAMVYPGGLPGDGGEATERFTVDGERDGDSVRFIRDDGSEGVVRDGTLMAYNADGDRVAEFQRRDRTSPTLGAKPPKDAVVLFNGSNADEWIDGKVSKKLLQVGPTSKRKFGDMNLHLEFMLPYMPKATGQHRANSGLYIQNRYEIQILDSFGLEGKHNECGGVYSQRDPDVNMCLAPLEWQTYDIDFVAPRFDDSGVKTADAKFTIKLNGVIIHKDYRPSKGTPPNPVEVVGPGPIHLQNHGNPVQFRNIWVVEK